MASNRSLQAGVPVVPIVIRTACGTAPRGDFIARPASVDVTVLPSIDTSEWDTDTIDEHVRDMRNLFARAPVQQEESAPKRQSNWRKIAATVPQATANNTRQRRATNNNAPKGRKPLTAITGK